MEPKYSALDLLSMFQERQEVLEDYTWHDLIISLANEELAYWKSMRVPANFEDPSEADMTGDYMEVD